MTKPVGCCGKNIEHCGVLAAVIGRVDLDRDGVCPEDGGEKLPEHNVLKLGHNYPPRLLVDFLIIPRWYQLMNLFSNSKLIVKKYHFLPFNIPVMLTNKESVKTLKARILIDSSVSSQKLFAKSAGSVGCRAGL